MDFDAYDELIDKELATRAMASIEVAISNDMDAQGRKFNKSKYGRWVHAKYKLNNQNAMRYGPAIGRKLISGNGMSATSAYIKGGDLARIIYYALHDEGHLPWVNLKEELKKERLEILLDFKPKTDPQGVVQSVYDGVKSFDYITASVAAQLRELADKVEPIEIQRNALFTQVSTQKLTIVKQANELTERNEFLNELEQAITRLKVGIAKEANELKKEKMIDFLTELLKKFESQN